MKERIQTIVFASFDASPQRSQIHVESATDAQPQFHPLLQSGDRAPSNLPASDQAVWPCGSRETPTRSTCPIVAPNQTVGTTQIGSVAFSETPFWFRQASDGHSIAIQIDFIQVADRSIEVHLEDAPMLNTFARPISLPLCVRAEATLTRASIIRCSSHSLRQGPYLSASRPDSPIA